MISQLKKEGKVWICAYQLTRGKMFHSRKMSILYCGFLLKKKKKKKKKKLYIYIYIYIY